MGDNCWVPECGMNRKTKGIYLHKFPITKHPEDIKWRENLNNMVRHYRDPKVDPRKLAERIESGKLFTCERHFRFPEDFDFTPTGKKKLKLYVMPTLNLPVKSHETQQPPERKPPTPRAPVTPKTKPSCYNDFDDFSKRLTKLKIHPWTFRLRETTMYIEHYEHSHILPRIQIRVKESLEFTIFIYNWPLPIHHDFYKNCANMRDVFVSDLLKQFVSYKICNGVSDAVQPSKVHSLPLDIEQPTTPGSSSIEVRRSNECALLTTSETCKSCAKCEKLFFVNLEKKNAYNNIPAKPQAPHSTTNPQKLILGLKQRLEAQQIEIKRLQKEAIEKQGVESEMLAPGIESFVTKTMETKDGQLTPFVKLFWEEQTKYNSMKSAKSVRYHPMIIRFALSLSMKSPAAYEELRRSGIMVLPSKRTLTDYKNATTPCVGFNPGVIADLVKICKDFTELDKFVVLSFDEVKIQSGLIFNKHTGKVIGFVDLGDEDMNSATLSKPTNMATHVLSFHLRNFYGQLKFNMGFVATDGAIAHQIFPLFWKAVGILEVTCKLKVIAAVCDGASPNRKFMKMHRKIDQSPAREVTYRTTNLYDPSRFIWFFSDYPHLIKTSRNSLFNSGYGEKFTRHMWNNGKYLEWKHIRDLYALKLSKLKTPLKLKEEHVNLSSYSKMKVNLAVQTLSATNALVLKSKFGPAYHGTAEFCSMMDKFFDIMNVRDSIEHVHKRKINLQPFKSPEDERLTWLREKFLKYLDDWQKSISVRKGFNAKEKEKMFISHQTMEGIRITVYSTIECVKFLLNSGMKYVLTERFTQDLLELYFGLQRACGYSNENPTLEQFGYNDNGIRMRGQLAKVRIEGNTKGAQKNHKYSWDAISDESVAKKSRSGK